MARRKKLNKRVVVFLAIAGTIVVVGGIGFLLKNLPQDAEALAERARKAAADGNYEAAEKAWHKATKASQEPKYFYEWAKIEMTIAEQPNAPDAKRGEKLRNAISLLRTAMRRDPNYVDAQRILVDIYTTWGGSALITEADKLLELVPDDHAIYYRRALAKATMARDVPDLYNEPAIADFRKAIELKNDESDYWLGLTSFYRLIKRHEDATKAFEEAIAANPDVPELRVRYADHLYQRDSEDEALQQIQEAINRAPDNAVGHLAMANVFFRQRDLDKALGALQAAKKADDSNYMVYYGISDVHRRNKEHGKAADALREGLAAITKRLTEQDEDELSQGARRRLQDARIELQYQLANSLLDLIALDLQQKDKLMPEVNSAIEQIEQVAPEGHARAKIVGRIALLEGRTDQAIALLEQADIGFRGTDAQVANLLLNLYRRNNPGKAEAIVDRYLQMPRHQWNTSLLLAKAQFKMRYHNYHEARQLVEKALKAAPDDPAANALLLELRVLTGDETKLPEKMDLSARTTRAMLDRSVSLWLSDQRAEAIELVADLHRRMPKDLFVSQRLCNMYLGDGQLEQCKAVLREAQALFPDNEVLKTQQELLEEKDPAKRLAMRLAMTEEAVEDPLRRAMAKAMVYAQAGKKADCYKQFQEAAKIDPNAPAAIRGMFRHTILERDWAGAEQAAEMAAKTNLDGLEGRLFAAQLAVAKRDFDAAAKALAAALADHPDSKIAQLSLGECYLMKEDYAKAAEQLRPIATGDPSCTPALIGMAKAAAGLGKTAEHQEWIQKAYLLAPTNEYVQQKYLIIEDRTAPRAQTIAKREKLLKRKPDDMDNRLRLAQLYMLDKQLEKAEAMFRAVWEHPETDKAAAARMLTGLYRLTGRYADGMKVLNELLEKTDDKVEAYVIWGEFLENYDNEQAENALKKAIEAGPDDERGYLAMAALMANQNRWVEAADATAKCLEVNPDAPDREKDLIMYLIRGDQSERADKLLGKLLRENPTDARAMMLKALVAIQKDQADEGLLLLDRAIEQDAKLGDAFYYRSQVHKAHGRINDARKDLEAARRLSSNPQIAMDLAEVMLSLGDPSAAQLIYKEILRSGADYRPAVIKLLESYLQQSRWAAMTKLLNRAQTVFPSDPTFALFEANMWDTRGQTDRAIAALRRAIKIKADYVPALTMYLGTLIEAEQYEQAAATADEYKNDPALGPWLSSYRGRALAKQGRLAEADSIFMAALRGTDQARLRLVVGQLARAYGAAKAAEKLAEWIPAIGPNNWPLHWQLGELYLSEEDNAKAIESFRQAGRFADTAQAKAKVSRSLGITYYVMGKFSQAEAAYLDALKVIPDDPEAMNDLACMYIDELDKPTDAVPYARKAAAAMPTSGSVVDTFGWALAKTGKLTEALEQLGRSAQLDPTVPDSRYHLGWTYEHLDRLRDAEIHYRQAFEMIRDDQKHHLYRITSEALQRVREKIKAEEL